MLQFTKKLSKLENTRDDVYELKSLAESLLESAKQIVELMAKEFKQANNDKKIAILYLIDALLKSNKDTYLKLIEEKIAEVFCDVYINSSDAAKHKLVLTYYSWEPYFSSQTMKKILFTIKRTTGDEVEKLLTEDDLNKLIDYYRKNENDPTHLEMARDELRARNKETKHSTQIKKSNIPHQSLVIENESDRPSKEVPNRPPIKIPSKPVENNSYKIPKKDNRIIDRDDDVQIKKKVLADTGNPVNMIDNYPNDMRQNPSYMGFDRGMRPNPSNNLMMQDNYSNQMNYDRRYNNQTNNVEVIDAEFSDDDDVAIRKSRPHSYQNNQAPITNQHAEQPINRTYTPTLTTNQHNIGQPPSNPNNAGAKNNKDILNLVTQFKMKTINTNDPRQIPEQKPKVEQQAHYDKQKNLELVPSLSNRKSSEFYEQTPALLFKSLLRMLKLGMHQNILKKYNKERKSLHEFSASNQMSVINALYKDIPYQCTTCALRFTHSTLLSKHLDWHFKTNREYKNKKENMKPRQPLLSIEGWLRDEGSNRPETASDEKGKEDFVFENYVLSDGDSKQCKACGEIFKEIWDKEKESWVLDGAVKAKYEALPEEEDAKLKKKKEIFDLMHFRCYKLVLASESGKN